MEYKNKNKEELISELESLRNEFENLKSSFSYLENENFKNKSNWNKCSEIYYNLINLGVDGIVLGTNEGNITEANDYFCQMAGCKKEDLIGKHISKVLFTDESLKNTPLRFDLLQKGEIVQNERKIKKADGTEIIIEMRTKMLPDGTYQSIYRDVTHRKKHEQQLLEKNQQIEKQQIELDKKNSLYEALISTLPIGVLMVEIPTGKPLLANKVADNFIKDNLISNFTIENFSKISKKFTYTNKQPYPIEKMPIFLGMQGIASHIDDLVVNYNDGSSSLFEIFGTPLKEKNGKLWACLVTFLDITNRKKNELDLKEKNEQIENQNIELKRLNENLLNSINELTILKEKIRESEIKYRTIIETTSDFIWETNLEGLYTFVSPQIEKLIGYKPEEVIGQSPFLNLVPEDLNEVIENSNKIVEKKIAYNSFITRIIDKNKNIVFIETSGVPIFNDNGVLTNYRGISRDVTERKNFELQLIEKNKKIEEQNEQLTQINNELFIANEKYQESEERYKNILKILPDGVIIHSEGKIVYVNQAACDIMHAKNFEDLIGKPVMDFVHKDYKDIASDRIKKSILKKENAEIIEEIFITTDNKLINVNVSAVPFYNMGKPSMLTVFTDVTQKKQAENELIEKNEQIKAQNEEYKQLNEELLIAKNTAEEHLYKNKALLSTFPDMMFVIDRNGTFIEYYTNNEQNLYAVPNAFIDKNIREVLPPEVSELTFNKIHEVFTSGKIVIYEYSLSFNRIVQFFEARMVYINEDKALAIIRDITERKKMLSELIIAKNKAEESDRLKSAFLANVSHEIRTPMNGILGFTQLLTSEDITTAQITEYTNIINKSGQQLLTIIDDLIDISKIEANQLKIDNHPVNINSIINDIFILSKSKAKNSSIDFKCSFGLSDELSLVNTDGNRLRQILMNLISNAFKFTKVGHIYFGYKLKGDMLEFFVDDTGKGIPYDMQSKIFDRFMQVETELSKLEGGTGLGLSISKSLAKLLGGKIWISSEPDKGSTFYFTIPYEKSEISIENNQKTIEKTIINNVKYSIIIAEDEDTNYIFLEILIKMMFHNIRILRAENGEEVINIVKKENDIKLILMDLKMPVINGYTASQEIKKMKPEIIIIAQTAYAQLHDKTKALEAGCDDYISKPINKEQLKELLSKYLKK